MIDISQKQLVGRFNTLCYGALSSVFYQIQESASRSIHPFHFLLEILNQPDSDIHRIVQAHELSVESLKQVCTEKLFELRSQSKSSAVGLMNRETQTGLFTRSFAQSIEDTWLYTTLVYEATSMRSGTWLLACLKHAELRTLLWSLSADFKAIAVDLLQDQLWELCADSPESVMEKKTRLSSHDTTTGMDVGQGQALSLYTENLTLAAKEGKIDPICGRDAQIRQILDILMRRRQNNPILTGEAGVGKTAVVEALALRLQADQVPPLLQHVQVHALDLSALQAGASVKGEFEKRLKTLIKEIQSSPHPIVLFIDEAHTLIGAGGAQGTGDAANILKPALARGQLRCVAATTWAEYKKYFEKDPALTRRFQVVKVEEPSEEQAIDMLRAMLTVMSEYHEVRILDEAIEAAVRLSHRFIPARQLPDKAVSLLDTACARVASSQHNVPSAIETLQAKKQALQQEREQLESEAALGLGDMGARLDELTQQIADTQSQLVNLQQKWVAEKQQVQNMQNMEPEGLNCAQAQLVELQGDSPFVFAHVNAQVVAAVVSDWTGIPVGKMLKDDIKAALQLGETLRKKVLGQDHALAMIAKRIQTAKAKIADPNKPIGVFLLVGPSGVGKTETAISLADTLFGGRQNLITINMSEFQEAHTVSTLKGSPPGYVGYGEGGVLTEAVRKKPYSVVLLDEVEKAHPDVHELFFQVFDKGVMEDGEGRQIDFKNTVILLTSNVGSDLIMQHCERHDVSDAVMEKALKPALLEVFPAALLGRMVTIAYRPLSKETLKAVITLHLGRIEQRFKRQHQIRFEYDVELVDWVLAQCQDKESGGRMIDNILTNTLLPELGAQLLESTLAEQVLERVKVCVHEGQLSYEKT